MSSVTNSDVRLLKWLAVVVAASSIAAAIFLARLASVYQKIFSDLNAPPPWLTQFLLQSCPLVGLGAVFSLIVWLFAYHHRLSPQKGLIILAVIEISTIAYVIVFPHIIDSTMFNIFDRLG